MSEQQDTRPPADDFAPRVLHDGFVLRSFYAQLGWEEWRGPLAGRKGTELLPTPDQKGIMVLRLARTPPLDIDSRLVIEYNGRIW